MRFYVDCVGCEQRQLDAQRIIDYLTANGHDRVGSPASADHSFLVTCGVEKAAEEASLRRLSQMAHEAKPGTLVVSGCLPDISPARLAEYGDLPTVSPRNLEQIDGHLAGHIAVPMAEISLPNSSVFDAREDPTGLLTTLTPRGEYDLAKKGYKIRVNNGCLMDCAYCVIKEAMGRVVSVPFAELMSQFRSAVDRKEPTIMFMGGDTGAYGYDIGPKTRFNSLLGSALEIHGNHRVYVHDFNVNWYLRDVEAYDEVFARNEETGRLRGVMLPVQSGSDRILQLMKRPYRHEHIARSVGNAKRSFKGLRLGTHIITGFPSESEADFDETLRLLDSVGFDFISCFVYSEHKRAKSAAVGGKVDPGVARKRARRIAERFGDRVRLFG